MRAPVPAGPIARRGVLLGLGALALGLGALAWAGQRAAVVFVTPALRREAAGEVAPPPVPPIDSLGLRVERVAYDTPLGPAPALWVPADGAGGLAALFVHGVGGRPEDGSAWLPALHARGIPTLLIATRGGPGAPTPPDGLTGLGLTEWEDAAAALRWLRTRGHDRFVLIGASMGGAVVGQLLRRPSAAEGVAAVALDAPMLDMGRLNAHILARVGVPLPGLASAMGLRLAAWRTGLDLPRARVTGTLAALPLPLLVAHGAGDRSVPVAGSDELVARRRGPTSYVRTAGDHLTAWATDPEAVGAAFGALLDGLE